MTAHASVRRRSGAFCQIVSEIATSDAFGRNCARIIHKDGAMVNVSGAQMTDALPMPNGLTQEILPLGPDMWHEFALGLDWADPHATIDLLIAADQIIRQPACDRATAALLLARASSAGFHRGQAPAGFDGQAARAFTIRLTDALLTGAFPTARLLLPPTALRLVLQQLGPRGPLPMPPFSFGNHPHKPPHAFAGWHLTALPKAHRRAA